MTFLILSVPCWGSKNRQNTAFSWRKPRESYYNHGLVRVVTPPKHPVVYALLAICSVAPYYTYQSGPASQLRYYKPIHYLYTIVIKKCYDVLSSKAGECQDLL